MFLLKVHESKEGYVCAICDKDVLGKKFEEGDLVLDVRESFYGGQSATADEIVIAIIESRTSNIVGNGIVAELVKRKVIGENSAITVSGVKHVQIFRM